MSYFHLLASFFAIGLGAYGGGLVTVGLIIHEVVEVRGWLDPETMAQVVTLSQMTPGPLAINTATFTGFKVQGVLGAILATSSVVLPSVILIASFLGLKSWLKDKPGHPLGKLAPRMSLALRPGMLALLLQAVYSFGKSALTDLFSFIVFGVSLLVFFLFPKVHPLFLMLGAGVLGMILL